MKEIAITAAKEAGKLLMEKLDDITLLESHEGAELNPVTKEDKDAEIKIIEIIKSKYPDHSFLAEEMGESEVGSEYKWIIDPIDGTNNYVEGRDTFSVSIGLEYKGEIILGVVYLPKRDELFVAEKGKRATMNGEPISVGSVDDLSKAKITHSNYPGHEEETEWVNSIVKPNIPNLIFFGFTDKKDVNETFGRGSMAAEFCYLACGRIDGLIKLKQKPWDVAAGSLIASEAGVKMCNLELKECSVYEGDYLAANPALLEKIAELFK